MRLGQLARQYDISVQEIIDFLQEETGEKFHPNAKLYDTLISKVYHHFEVLPPEIASAEETTILAETEAIEETDNIEDKDKETPEDDIAAAGGELMDIEAIETKEHIELPKHVIEEKPNEDEVIQSDKLLEMLESEEPTSDLDKIKLIKAPKKELAGLKVLGKVDLPEPKKKINATEKEIAKPLENKPRPQLSEKEKEKRRLRAKRKKEAYEARQEKRKKEQEAKRLKELKAQHYKQKLQKSNMLKPKPYRKIEKVPDESAQSQSTEGQQKKPKTWLGKWWQWMNTA